MTNFNAQNFKLPCLSLLFFMSFVFMVVSCSKDDEQVEDCTTLQVTYNKDVAPIFNQNCASSGCHGAPQAAAGYALDDYINSRLAAMSGRLLGSIKHQSGFSAMPKGASKLSNEDIQIINCWIDTGMPE